MNRRDGTEPAVIRVDVIRVDVIRVNVIGEYEPLCRALDVERLALAPDSTTRIDPLRFLIPRPARPSDLILGRLGSGKSAGGGR